MSVNDPTWLTLQQAANRAGCSVKTLYRLMHRGRLGYRRGGDNRRYVSADQVHDLFPDASTAGHTGIQTELEAMKQQLQKLENQLEIQTALIEHAIALYQPRDVNALLAKHWPEDYGASR
ncbi:AlpA family transcriptional regulator [Thioalkalivibrio sp. ALE11]|uniref:helix-turn-helix transcriptional regulator n=1 Tax=Thioalkalivibrio sp. ALE11 TaxID=1265494 RepID=UPI00035C7105|nr:helix-turn-helix domain-containing protein [Thioalkalivibrio sp. ALE11]